MTSSAIDCFLFLMVIDPGRLASDISLPSSYFIAHAWIRWRRRIETPCVLSPRARWRLTTADDCRGHRVAAGKRQDRGDLARIKEKTRGNLLTLTSEQS